MVVAPFVAAGALVDYPVVALAGLFLAAWLSVENGGNDVSKGVAPIVAAGLTSEGRALLYGTLITFLGSLASLVLATGLFKLFTAGIVAADVSISATMVLAMAAGAALWVALATRLSMPVSTTHALVGAVASVGAIAYGPGGVQWASLGTKVVVPLLLSPVAGLGVAWIATRLVGSLRMPTAIESTTTWVTSGAICFVRAVNDTPKVAALAALAAAFSVSPQGTSSTGGGFTVSFVIVAIAMSAGSLLKGLAVTQLLARKVTKLDAAASMGAPSAASALILAASQWGLPVSTTHVSTAAIVGAGLATPGKSVYWHIVRDIALSWLVTLPVAGLIGVAVYLVEVALVPSAR
jgi:phosphate/sulfate permease